jgi:hypothetical protein
MTTTTKPMRKAAGADNTNGLTTYPTGCDFRTGVAENQTKSEITLIAKLAIGGHAVQRLDGESYLVTKWGYSHHAADFAELQAFAKRLGVMK